jgi:hypothetical protein
MIYINIGDIKELAIIGAVAGKDTTSAPPTEIVWNVRELRAKGCDRLLIGRSGVSTSLCEVSLGSFFEIISQRREFSFIKFDRTEYKESNSHLYMLFDDFIPFSIHSIS